ncbi:uncharacterized protein LOC108101321 [Drosophila ficusphila]|uniref:uncharacterized protein LOC108101321 n=1 Tax=Drosophila ficusphila TaxID=30025 RepID=UPI0007E7BA03|nr:uncharacterized protein LOC108101321 [Drosophila ficusphila]
MSLTPNTFIVFLLIWSLVFWQAFADFSLNNYGDSAFPDRCVLDIGSSMVLLKTGESFRLKNLPCTTVFCVGDGYGMLSTCDKKEPPEGCLYTDYLNWDDDYPDCCNRNTDCD